MKLLEEELLRCNDVQLRHIYRLWGMSREAADTFPVAARHLPILSARFNNLTATRFVWDHLTVDERLLLYRLIMPTTLNGATRSSFQHYVGLPEERFAAALHTLKQYLLVYEEQRTGKKGKATDIPSTVLCSFPPFASTLYATGREIFSSALSAAEMSVEQLLNVRHFDQVQHIAARYQLVTKQRYMSAPELARLIAYTQLQPAILDSIVQELPPEQRTLLTWLCTHDGKVSMQAVRAYTAYDDDALYKVLRGLEEYALAFDGFTRDGWLLCIPYTIYDLVEELVGQKIQLPPAHLEAVAAPQVTKTSETLILYDLAIILNATYQQLIQPTQAGRLPKRLAAKLRALLHGLPRYNDNDEDDYSEMLYRIALEFDLLSCPPPPLPDMKAAYEVGKGVQAWSHLSILQQTRRLLRHWLDLKHSVWLDILADEDVIYSRNRGDLFYSWNMLLARAALCSYLSQCTPGQWYSVASLLETIWRENPHVLYMTAPRNRSQKPLKREQWMRAEGKVFTLLLASTLYELGIVDLGYASPLAQEMKQETKEHNFQPVAFMLTALGAGSLADEEPQEIGEAGKTNAEMEHTLIVQPNFELLLLQPDMHTLYSLLPFAQVQQVSQVSRLTLTRASLMRGLLHGLKPGHILETLGSHSQKELPQNVEYTLNDWARLYKGARLSQAVVIEVSSEAVADELATSAKFKALDLRRVGPCALVTHKDLNGIRSALDKEGIAISVSGGDTGRRGVGLPHLHSSHSHWNTDGASPRPYE